MRDTALRVLPNIVATPSVLSFKLANNSAISTLWRASVSSITLPGLADDRISALSGALIGASPSENVRKRRS